MGYLFPSYYLNSSLGMMSSSVIQMKNNPSPALSLSAIILSLSESLVDESILSQTHWLVSLRDDSRLNVTAASSELGPRWERILNVTCLRRAGLQIGRVERSGIALTESFLCRLVG